MSLRRSIDRVVLEVEQTDRPALLDIFVVRRGVGLDQHDEFASLDRSSGDESSAATLRRLSVKPARRLCQLISSDVTVEGRKLNPVVLPGSRLSLPQLDLLESLPTLLRIRELINELLESRLSTFPQLERVLGSCCEVEDLLKQSRRVRRSIEVEDVDGILKGGRYDCILRRVCDRLNRLGTLSGSILGPSV